MTHIHNGPKPLAEDLLNYCIANGRTTCRSSCPSAAHKDMVHNTSSNGSSGRPPFSAIITQRSLAHFSVIDSWGEFGHSTSYYPWPRYLFSPGQIFFTRIILIFINIIVNSFWDGSHNFYGCHSKLAFVVPDAKTQFFSIP